MKVIYNNEQWDTGDNVSKEEFNRLKSSNPSLSIYIRKDKDLRLVKLEDLTICPEKKSSSPFDELKKLVSFIFSLIYLYS